MNEFLDRSEESSGRSYPCSKPVRGGGSMASLGRLVRSSLNRAPS